MAGKKPSVLEKAPPRSSRWLVKPPSGGAWQGALAVLAIAAFAGGVFVLWQHVRETVLAGADYRLDPADVQITPPPAWVHGDVLGEALRNASLDDSPSILAPDLTQRVAEAFAMHPWVAKVQSVRKLHPARVQVELIYRRPVCMVELPGGGLFPVDADGIVLPTADFTPQEARQYPRLTGITTLPVGPVGARWGDARVAGGAAVASALVDSWNTLGLARIVASKTPVSRAAADDYTYDLVTQAGTSIPWGRAPNSETPGDPPAVEKVARLQKHFIEYGTLDRPEGQPSLDLRQRGETSPLTSTGPSSSSTDGWRAPTPKAPMAP